MSYTSGGLIEASDINGFLARVRAIYAVGNGPTGYGQTSPSLGDVSVGDIVDNEIWLDMRTAIARCASHQGDSTASLPPTNLFEDNDIIQSHPPATGDFDSLITAIETNPQTATPGDMTLTNNVHSSTRVGTWGGGVGPTTINTTIRATFPSTDAARYFFNSGGEFRFRMSQPGSASQDMDWSNVLGTRMGIVAFNWTTTTRTGTHGTPNPIGYYDLTTSLQTIFAGTNIGGAYSAAYSANDITIQARRVDAAGANGGNGSILEFVFTLSDQHTSAFYDQVSSGTNLAVDQYKAANGGQLSNPNIPAPVFSTTDSF